GDVRGRVRVLRRPRIHRAEEARDDGVRGRRGGRQPRVGPAPCRGGQLMDDRPRYMISIAAEIVGMHPQTLRIYETKGLVRPGRTPGGTRLYSERDLDRLRTIQRLTTELGLNLAGVQPVLMLEDELARLRGRVEGLGREMRGAVEAVHKQYRRGRGLYSETQRAARLPRRR